MLNKSSLVNDGVHLHSIIDSTECKRHKAGLGEPCWSIYISALDSLSSAACGPRVKRAGFNGQITPESLSRGSRINSKQHSNRRK